jgi:hypothetical protein
VDIQVRLARRDGREQCRLGTCRGAAVGGDVRRIPAPRLRLIQKDVETARRHSGREADEKRCRGRDTRRAGSCDRGGRMDVTRRRRSRETGEVEMDVQLVRCRVGQYQSRTGAKRSVRRKLVWPVQHDVAPVFTVPALLGITNQRLRDFAYGAVTRYGRTFQNRSAIYATL